MPRGTVADILENELHPRPMLEPSSSRALYDPSWCQLLILEPTWLRYQCGFVNVDDNLDGVLGYREVDDVRSVDLTSSFPFPALAGHVDAPAPH